MRGGCGIGPPTTLMVAAAHAHTTHFSRCLCRPYSNMTLRGVSGLGLSSKPTTSLILSQWRSRIPGLQNVCRRGRCSLNLSSFILKSSVERFGLGCSANVRESLCMVRHIVPTSSSTCSAFSSRKGPGREGGGWRKHVHLRCCRPLASQAISVAISPFIHFSFFS